MNRFVYTITTIIFVLIAGATTYMVLQKDDVQKPVAVEQIQEEAKETPEEEVAEPEPTPEVVQESEPEEEQADETTYYTYKVVNANWLNVRAEDSKSNKSMGVLPNGYTGYVVKMTGSWTLICAEGRIGYCNDTYLEFQEIDASEYPEELKGYDESSAGASIAEGRMGAVEESNTRTVRWY